MEAKERDEHQITCPRCAGAAEWSYFDTEKVQIEVIV